MKSPFQFMIPDYVSTVYVWFAANVVRLAFENVESELFDPLDRLISDAAPLNDLMRKFPDMCSLRSYYCSELSRLDLNSTEFRITGLLKKLQDKDDGCVKLIAVVIEGLYMDIPPLV